MSVKKRTRRQVTIFNFINNFAETTGEKLELTASFVEQFFTWLYRLLLAPSLKRKEETGLSDEQWRQVTRAPRGFKVLSGVVLLLAITVLAGVGLYLGGPARRLVTKITGERAAVKKPEEKAAARAPELVRFRPRGAIDDLDEIYLSFNKPMVEPDRVDELFQKFPLKMEPELEPRFMWKSNKQLRITTEEPIPPATRVRFSLADTPIRDVEGNPLAGSPETSMEFIYLPLEVQELNFRGKDEGAFNFQLEFNAPVAASELDKRLTVELEAGETVPYILRNPEAEDDRHLIGVDKPDLFGKKIYFNVSKGLTTAGGNYPLQQSVTESYKLGELKVSYLRGRSSDGEPYVKVDFNRRLEGIESMEEHIVVDNDTTVDFNVSKSSWDDIKITSDRFEFGKRYPIHFEKGLSSGIFKLTESLDKTVNIPDASSSLEVKGGGFFQSLSGERVLPLEHVNTDEVHITAYDIYDNNLIFFANHYKYSTNDFELFRKLKEARYELGGERNQVQTSHIDLENLFEGEMNGPKLLKINHDGSYRTKNKLLIPSDLGISCKRYEDEMVFLVTSLADGSPVGGATVKLYSRANQVLVQGRTDERGFLRLENLSFDQAKPTVVVAEKGDDVNYLHLEEGEVPTVSFDVEGDKYTESGEIEAYVYGERELYRPGSKVKLNVLARGRDFNLIPDLPLKVTITGPDGDEVLSREVRANELGIASVNYQSWADDKTGFYDVTVELPGEDQQVGREQFQLEEFMPDRIETTVEPRVETATAGETVGFEVRGKFLFGKPASGNEVQAAYTIYPASFQPEKFSAYEFGDPRVQFKQMRQQLELKNLNDEGTGSYDVEIPENLGPPAALDLVLNGTVFDLGSRGVSDRASVRVHPYPYYIGVKSDLEDPDRADYGDPVNFDIVTVGPTGDTVAGDTLRVQIYREEWNYSLRRDSRGRTSYEWDREEVLINEQSLEPEAGVASFSHEISRWGDHRLVVSDPESGARTAYKFSTGRWWRASGAGRKIDFDRAELTFDQPKYFAGETARLKLEAPFDGTAYIFREDRDIELLKRVKVSERSASFEVELDRSMVPNTYITALVLRGTHDANFDAYRSIAVSPVEVVAPDRLAEVDLELPEKMRPGETEPVRVELNSPSGRPVDGEVALSVVDQGIIQKVKQRFKDPYKHFYRKRGYFIKNVDLYNFVLGEPKQKVRRKLTPAGAAPEEAERKQPFEAEQFEAVSSWYPHLETEGGSVTVDYPVPGYSGQLNFRAWAVTENRVGRGQTKKRVKEPVILRTVRPRTLTPGDTFSLPVTVINNLDRQLDGRLQIQTDHMLQPAWSDRNVVVEADGRVDREVVMKVNKDVGVSRLELSFRAGRQQVEKEHEIPVKPAYSRKKTTEFHSIRADSDYSAEISADFFEGIGSHKFVVSTMPDVKMLSGLDYLVNYPYGCIEQTTSSVFPQLYLGRILKKTDPELNRAEEIDNNINAGIERLMDMAQPDGSFAYWPGRSGTHKYGTVYAGHFFAEAKRAGYPVPDSFLSKNKKYLESMVKRRRTGDELRAYALYVLALHGDYDNVALARRLLDRVDGYHEYYLVSALVLSGEKQAVSGYLYDETPTTGEVERTTGGVLRSNVISKAVVLNALLETGEELPGIEAIASELLQKAEAEGHWGTTQDNAQALIALGKYFSRYREENADFEGRLSVDGEQTFSFESGRDTAFIVYGNAEQISVSSSGRGRIHLSVISEGIPPAEQQVEVSQGMELEHEYYNLEGDTVGANRFKQGQMYVVEVRAEVHEELDNFYVEDRLPGGFEIENQRLATSRLDVPALDQAGLEPEYLDVRDDRIAFFFDADDAGKQVSFRYLVRATTAGSYSKPVLSGGCMYDPDVQAVRKLEPVRVVR